MTESGPIQNRILEQLATKGGRVSAAELYDIQYGLGMQDVSRTKFRTALGALANRGELTWQRPSWGSPHVVRLGVYKGGDA